MADKTAGKQRGRPFLRGESGNPAGRPMGARHKATVAAEALLDGEAEALTRKAVELGTIPLTKHRLCPILEPCRVICKIPSFKTKKKRAHGSRHGSGPMGHSVRTVA